MHRISIDLRRAVAALGIGATLLLSAPLPSYAQDTVTLNFVNADIPSVVQAIGKHTGKNFIIDPRVTGNMNLLWNTPVPRDAAYPILLSALRVHGYAAIEERGVVKIVPESDAKTNGPVIDGKSAIGGDRVVTEVIALKHESAAQLATMLRPLVPPNNFIGAYPGNNSIVITDYAENVKRIAKIISYLDLPGTSELQMMKLTYASAVDIANLLKGVMPEATLNPAAPGVPPKVNLGVEPRTNSLIIRADTPALVARVKAFVAGLDTPTAAGGNIHVVYLRNAEAVKLAETLRALMAASSAPAASTTTALTPTTTPATMAAASSPAQSGTIQAYPATNSLVIIAPDNVYNSLRTVIDKLDARRAQVLVDALIVEVSASVSSEFGIQWQDLTGINKNGGAQVIGGTNFGSATGGQNIISAAQGIGSVGTGLNIGIVRGKVNIPGVGEVINLGMLARALEDNQKGNILSRPNILTLDNEEAKFVVGQNVPFVTGAYTQSGTSSTNPFQTIERKDVGLTLKVTPQVSEGGAVKLKAFLEVSSVVPTTSSVKSADLITNKRSVENTVLVDDGQIVVIGGLIADDTKNGNSQVPILGDIPFIGNLFKYQTRSREKTNLMVFLRPYVLRDGQSANQLTGERYDFIRNEQGTFIKEGESLLPPTGSAQLPPLAPAPAPAAAPAAAPAPEKK